MPSGYSLLDAFRTVFYATCFCGGIAVVAFAWWALIGRKRG